MHSLLISFNGNSNIGLYAFLNDKFMLLGREVNQANEKKLKEVFDVPIHKLTIAGTSLIGVFITGDNEKILVPSIIFDEEKELLDKLNIDYEIYETKHTCLGNNILVLEHIVYVNPDFTSQETKEIGEIFKRPSEKKKIAGIGTVGSLFVQNPSKKKAIISNEVSEEELKEMEKITGFEISPSSVNMGSQYVKSGILVNKNGFAIGSQSGSPEILHTDEALGFLEDD